MQGWCRHVTVWAALVVGLTAPACSPPATSASAGTPALCRTLSDLTVDGSLPVADDTPRVVAALEDLEGRVPEPQATDVRTIRDGLARVLELAAAHPDAPDLASLPPAARQEVANTLHAISRPAQRIEAYRRYQCARATEGPTPG